MLDPNWNPITGHLIKCVNKRGAKCIGRNKDGSVCKNRFRVFPQSCDHGLGSFCATHYSQTIGPHHIIELSKCANVRCDQLGIEINDRKKIHQYNIHSLLGLPGDNVYNHISKSQQKKFNWQIVPEVDIFESPLSIDSYSSASEQDSNDSFVNDNTVSVSDSVSEEDYGDSSFDKSESDSVEIIEHSRKRQRHK